ncbi:UvrD-helicase domain-containing protein [Flavicella sp.]|uniref:UvrD-helicase domain-containing protein n=1 Tax=Flavicella sp. TaxID=2957742 RepID=UPI00301614B2
MTNAHSFHVYNASAGSGKTFTLVKEYLKILLTSESDYIFQNILAITFTNKAATEMKERVLENLRAFSNGESNDMFDLIIKENKLNSEKLQEKSRIILENVLQNYSAFNITTIDSFTHKLIRTFAYDLGLPLNFDVEMDGSKLISEAVDVLISKIGGNKELTDVLVSFSLQKVEDDKAWDISKELNSIASILLNETDANHVQKLQLKKIAHFKEIEKLLKVKKKEIEKLFKKNGNKGLTLIENAGLEPKNFPYATLPKHFVNFTNLAKLKYDNIKFDGARHKNIAEAVFYSKSAKPNIKSSIDAIGPELLNIYQEGKVLYNKHHGDYLLIDMVLKSIIPLAVLNHIQKELNEIKEQNSICLSAEFNSMISEKIKNEPAPFIYERIGERFKHFFIDEMQDTSSLQWQNLIPLINNTLSQEGGSLMLVGDAKQAIYRWRGGKAEQFIDLSLEEKNIASNPFYVEKKLENLATNFRSFSEVILFNNKFFSHIASFLNNPTYKDLYERGNKQGLNKNIGGYVQLDFLDRSELSKEEKEISYPAKVLEIVQGLDANFKRNDVCIIVRTKKDGIAVANYLTENGVDIISSETLLLQNSLKVQFVINLLTYIQNPLNINAKFKTLNYLKNFINIGFSEHLFYTQLLELETEEFFKALQVFGIVFEYPVFLKMPFYESIEYLIRSYKLLSKTDAYVQFFLDFILDFQRKNHHDLSAFLLEWEQKKGKLSIAVSEGVDAVRIMTIHKSKGLEFPVVVFPCDRDVSKELNPTVWYDDLDQSVFGGLSTSMISCAKRITYIGEKGEEIYDRRQSELTLDNFNLLYVSLTRAVEQLYIVTEYQINKKTGIENTHLFSGLFINYLKSIGNEKTWELGKLSYSFGQKNRFLPMKKKKESESVEIQKKFISSPWESHEIKIVSNSSKHWGKQHEQAVNYGLLIHEMLSKIITEKDMASVIDLYVNSGLVLTKDIEPIRTKLEKVIHHKELNKYFQKGYEIYNEREIIDKNKNVLIPDRLMINGKEVVIIDFKTGKKLNKYKAQVDGYATVLKEIGYKISGKYCVYIDKNIIVDSLD